MNILVGTFKKKNNLSSVIVDKHRQTYEWSERKRGDRKKAM